MVKLNFVRLLRTSSSERFMVQQDDKAIAALELHYLTNGEADGTLIVFTDARIPEEQIPDILKQIDEQILPGFSIEDKNLFFTVVIGQVHGAFVPHR